MPPEAGSGHFLCSHNLGASSCTPSFQGGGQLSCSHSQHMLTHVLSIRSRSTVLPSITNSEGKGLSLLLSCPQGLFSNCQGSLQAEKWLGQFSSAITLRAGSPAPPPGKVQGLLSPLQKLVRGRNSSLALMTPWTAFQTMGVSYPIFTSSEPAHLHTPSARASSTALPS